MDMRFRRPYKALQKQVDEFVANEKETDAAARIALRDSVVEICRNDYPMGVIFCGFAEHEITASQKRRGTRKGIPQ